MDQKNISISLLCYFFICCLCLASVETTETSNSTTSSDTKNCMELFSTSLDIQCFYKEEKRNCEEPSINNMIAKLKCKQFYYHKNIPYDTIKCENGKWDKPLFSCTPECGKKILEDVDHGLNAWKGQFPWYVGLYVYHKKNDHYKYQCGGSIITENLVITAAHCIYPGFEYYVAAGKYHRQWNSTNDKYQQFRKVIHFILPERYSSPETNFNSDIAILVLKKGFIFTNYVRPICIDYEDNFFAQIDHKKRNDAVVPGWGYMTKTGILGDTLNYLEIPVQQYNDCLHTVPPSFKSHVTPDKFCASRADGKNVCGGDSGGGLVYKRTLNNTETLYYLIGIVSASLLTDGKKCDVNNYTIFTKIESHTKWIQETKMENEFLSRYDYGCQLPQKPDFGTYTIVTDSDNERNKTVDDLVKQFTVLQYKCAEQYDLNESGRVVCKNNMWNDDHALPICFKSCSGLISSEFNITCSLDKTEIACDKPVPHLTTAKYKCASKYYETAHTHSKCFNGQWINTVQSCISKCGMKPKRKQKISKSPQNVVSAEYPWHAGIYSTENNEFKCSGIIVSPVLIVTHKWCDFFPHESFAAVGKNNNIIQNDWEPYEQRANISGVYYSSRNMWVLLLKIKFTLTSFVYPACLSANDFGGNYNTIGEFEASYWTSDSSFLTAKTLTNDDIKQCEGVNCDLKTNIGNNATGIAVQLQNTTAGLKYGAIGVLSAKRVVFFVSYETESINDKIKEYSILTSSSPNECLVPELTTPNLEYNSVIFKQGFNIPEGKTIEFICKSSFTLYGSKYMTCEKYGWKYPDVLPQCAKCGNTMFFNGTINTKVEEINDGHVPWNVFIYNGRIDHEKEYEFIQSGTIITPNVVLTTGPFHNATFIATGHFKINAEQKKEIQVSEVQKRYNHYSSQLVVLVVKTSFLITDHVYPPCIDINGFITEKMLQESISLFPILSENEDKLQFVILPKNTNPTKKKWGNSETYDTYDFKDEIYSDKLLRGSALASLVETRTGMRYYLRSVLSFIGFRGDASLTEVFAAINWLNNILNHNQEICEKNN